MNIQHVIKGIPALTRSQAQQILAEGIHCNWVLNYSPIRWDEIPLRLTADNLDWHQNRYSDRDPNFSPRESFSRHTGFISTTAGTYLPSGRPQLHKHMQTRLASSAQIRNGRLDNGRLICFTATCSFSAARA